MGKVLTLAGCRSKVIDRFIRMLRPSRHDTWHWVTLLRSDPGEGHLMFPQCLSASEPVGCESRAMSVRHAAANRHAGLSPSRERCLQPDFVPVQLDLVTNDRRDSSMSRTHPWTHQRVLLTRSRPLRSGRSFQDMLLPCTSDPPVVLPILRISLASPAQSRQLACDA